MANNYYMATILTNSHYDGIRALFAPDVTSAHLSDAYLAQRPLAPEAERTVRKRLKAAGIDADMLTGDDLEDALLAMMHECAGVLCLTAPQQLRQNLIGVITDVQEIDWKEKRMFHISKVDELVNDIVERVAIGQAQVTRKRRNPFGAVGTQRSEHRGRINIPVPTKITPTPETTLPTAETTAIVIETTAVVIEEEAAE